MSDINWNKVVDLELRRTQRPDASFRFSTFAAGSLDKMVRHAVSRTGRDRNRLAIKPNRLGRLEMKQINGLYAQPDFPDS